MGIKANWMRCPASDFETLAFGDLAVGEQFISLPCPGDNSGHGGFKVNHIVFTKIEMDIVEAAPGLPYGIPHGRARNSQGTTSDMPHSMHVIRIC